MVYYSSEGKMNDATAKVTITFDYPIHKGHYVTDDNPNPSPQECVAYDKKLLDEGNMELSELLSYQSPDEIKVNIEVAEE